MTISKNKLIGEFLYHTVSFKCENHMICEKLAQKHICDVELEKELPPNELTNCYYSLWYCVLSINIILYHIDCCLNFKSDFLDTQK